MSETTEIVTSLPTSQPLKVWERLCLVVGDDDQAGIYIARIEDFQNDSIVITCPEFIQGNTRLRDGVQVTVQVTREDAVYQFHSLIRQRTDSGRTRGFLARPSALRRVQRRRFVRIPVSQPLLYTVLSSPLTATPQLNDEHCLRAVSVDVSGGGMLIRPPQALTVRDRLLVQFDYLKKIGIPDQLLCVCRRVSIDKQGTMAGLEFILKSDLANHFSAEESRHIPPAAARFDSPAQNKLVSFVFGEQISMRKKGLL